MFSFYNSQFFSRIPRPPSSEPISPPSRLRSLCGPSAPSVVSFLPFSSLTSALPLRTLRLCVIFSLLFSSSEAVDCKLSTVSFFSHSPAKCFTTLPSGRHSASTFPRSSAVKSGPLSAVLVPFRLTCITPTTFPSNNIGALTILWIDSPKLSPSALPQTRSRAALPKNCC